MEYKLLRMLITVGNLRKGEKRDRINNLYTEYIYIVLLRTPISAMIDIRLRYMKIYREYMHEA
jgi:hypothetical protein